MTTYKLYLTVELPGEYESKDAAMDAAVTALQDACTHYVIPRMVPVPKPIEARVFAEGAILHGGKREFIVDICDGAI